MKVATKKPLGKSILLYLAEGSPSGVIHAEIKNWTGQVVVCPLSEIAKLKELEETNRPGIYILSGTVPSSPPQDLIYIGESDNVYRRLARHVQNDTEDFWDRCVIVTSKDENLTKGHIRYLESKVISLTKVANRVELKNSNFPEPPSLPKADVSDMEYFLQQIELILPVLGFNLLQVLPDYKVVKRTAMPGDDDWDYEKFPVFYIDSVGIFAVLVIGNSGLVMMNQSTARMRGAPSWSSYVELRDQLVADGSLVPSEDGEHYIFSRPVTFNSPSAAASVAIARNTNGPKTWKNMKTNQTYKEWMSERLGE